MLSSSSRCKTSSGRGSEVLSLEIFPAVVITALGFSYAALTVLCTVKGLRLGEKI